MYKIPLFLVFIFIYHSCAVSYIPLANIAKARNDISTIRMAITSYYLQYGKYPDQLTWEEDIKIFLEGEVPLDPWGNHYTYKIPGIHVPEGYDLYSKGKDKKSVSGGNDSDDISNWSLGNKEYVREFACPDYVLFVGLLFSFLYKVAYTVYLKNRQYRRKFIAPIFRLLNIFSIVFIGGIIIASVCFI